MQEMTLGVVQMFFPRPKKTHILTAIAALSLCLAAISLQSVGLGASPYGRLELDVKSDYSHVRIRRADNVRTMMFVRDSGQEVVESIVDLDRPHELLVNYTRFMFLSYLFQPRQERALIVGLGGGSMIHFLKRYDPEVNVDVVEIDPAIVKMADEYFRVRSEGKVNIMTADGVEYLTNTELKYNVIYMDAFLKPSAETDSTGAPLRLKTSQFYKEIQKKLTPQGVVVFNLNTHSDTREDIKTIRDSFPQTYVYRVNNSSNLVLIASLSQRRQRSSVLITKAAELDRRFNASFSFQTMARRLGR